MSELMVQDLSHLNIRVNGILNRCIVNKESICADP